ncbi:NACHT domain-containing protein [Micromonospora rubida]|uniref:NACHT domain-containing protein n=1 Tax=Micromonospora rubida TaxID=2697657 RepID=A0ABW7STW7_9ACTN
MTGGLEVGIIRAVARPLLADRNALEMLKELDDLRGGLLANYIGSAQFEQIALTLTLAIYNGSADVDLLKVREELRLSLLRFLGDDYGQMFELTEVAYNILLSAAHSIQSTYRIPPNGIASPLLLATTAKLTAASARNCELLAKSKDLAVYEDFCATLRAQAKAAYGTMRLPHAGLNRAVPYSKIFVQPDVIKYRRAQDSMESRRPTRTSVSKLIATRLRFVLLGDPGAGKSTSANKLAFDIATNKISELSGRVPFLVQLRDHTENLKSSPGATVIDFIKASCNRPHHVFPAAEQIEYALLSGRAVVILDGVDELGDSSLRAQLAKLVEGFATRYPLTQIMVTSREVGYFDAPLNEDAFPVFQVAPFNDRQILSYSNKWFQAGAGAYQLSATEMSSAFIRESGDTVPDLRTNPLLLSLLCGMYASTQYLPRNRPEVYEKCAEMLFERWDRSRGVHVPLRFAADVRPAVQQLAWLLLNDDKSRVALPRSEIVTFLTDYLKGKRYEDEDEAYQAANDFIDFCPGRAWALSEVGSNLAEPLYGFTHRTFLNILPRAGSSATAPTRTPSGKRWEIEYWTALGGRLAIFLCRFSTELSRIRPTSCTS